MEATCTGAETGSLVWIQAAKFSTRTGVGTGTGAETGVVSLVRPDSTGTAAAEIDAAVTAAAVGAFVRVKAAKPFTGDLDFGKSGKSGLPSASS